VAATNEEFFNKIRDKPTFAWDVAEIAMRDSRGDAS
jgi:hypothetical protein